MNVSVENLGPCKKLVRFEVEAAKVDAEFENTTKEVVRHAALPGFRPGKAPRDIIMKKFEKEIHDQVKNKLISDSYEEAVKEHKLQVIGQPDIEEIQFNKGQPLQFAATIETVPEFELPLYRGLPAKREASVVTEEDINRAIEALRLQQATYKTVDRPAQEGDFLVVNYTGTSEGKPLTDYAPTARGLTQQKGFWIEIKKESFIVGFTEQLTGAKAGEKRTVTVDFPADFVTPQLAGKKGVYEVEVTEVKERVLPELNEAFAKVYGAENLEGLREGIRADLQNELNLKQKKSIRAQVVQGLYERVNFDLPDTLVQHETRAAVYDIVSNVQKQGATKEIIDQQKEEIYAMASRNAKDRVKVNLLLQRIAEKEGIRIGQEELNGRMLLLARQYKMSFDKFAKEAEKTGGLQEIYLQLLHEKTIDFLVENAKIEDAHPKPASP